MTRKSIFLALSALIIAIGFVSCSDDNGNGGNNGNMNVTYKLRFNNNNLASTELTYIASTYRKALGIETDSITVQGANRDVCDSLFAMKLKTAYDALNGKEWNDTTKFEAYAAKEDTALFQIIYQPVSNKTITTEDYGHYWSQFANGEENKSDNTRDTLFSIQNLCVDYKDEPLSDEFFYDRHYSYNINTGNNGKYVYISYRDCKYYQEPITDIIAVEYANKLPESVITWNGHKYKLCGNSRDDFSIIHVSLNEGNNGKQYYLYYSTDNIDNSTVCTMFLLYSTHHKQISKTKWHYFLTQKTELISDMDIYDQTELDTKAYNDVEGDRYNFNKALELFNMKYRMKSKILQLVDPNKETPLGNCCLNEGALGVNYYLYIESAQY